MTFGILNGKTEYMVIGGKEHQVESVTSSVRSGKIERVKDHKAVGTWFDESGNYDINIKKKHEKLSFMIHTTKKEANPKEVGTYAVDGRLNLANNVVIPGILYNAEAFPSYKDSELKELEQIQHTILVGILEMPKTTPYYPLLLETGWWTMSARLGYKKLMLYHKIVNSDERRVMKKMLDVQKKELRTTTWYSNILKEVARYGINQDPTTVSKSKWKKHVKAKINDEVEQDVKKRCRDMKKARVVKDDDYKKKEYLTKCTVKETKGILKTRLMMNRIPANFKGKTEGNCPLCEE